VSSGTTEQKKYGVILLGRSASTGTITFEAQIKGENLQPLPRDQKPTVFVKRPADFDPKLDQDTPEKFEMRPKNLEGEWHGWFVGSFKVRTPGEYEFRIPIPGVSQALTHRLMVRKPNLEMDNVRQNHGALFQLASEAAPTLKRLPSEVQQELSRMLQPPAGEETSGKEGVRLFFPLANADAVEKCLTKMEPKRESTKGKLLDLWDDGVSTGLQISAYHLILLVVAGVGLLACGILCFLRQYWAALGAIGTTAVLLLITFLCNVFMGSYGLEWLDMPLDLSFVLTVVVSLLGIEWLTRKLLRLA
jgi:hypothetical protein